MADMISSLVQTFQAGPPQTQTARVQRSRQVPGRKDLNDGAGVDQTRKPEESRARETVPRKGVDAPQASRGRAGDAGDQTDPGIERARSGERNFRQVLQDRLTGSGACKNAGGDKQERKSPKTRTAPEPVFAALAGLTGDSGLEILRNKVAFTSGGGRGAQASPKTVAGEQTRQKAPADAKAGPEETKTPHAEKVSTEKVSDSETRSVKKEMAAAKGTPQSESSLEKGDKVDKNAQNSTGSAENAARTKPTEDGIEQDPAAGRTGRQGKMPTAQPAFPDKTTAGDAAKAGEMNQASKVGNAAPNSPAPAEEPAPAAINRATRPAAAAANRMTAGESAHPERDARKTTAIREGASTGTPEVSSEVAQVLKVAQDAVNANVIERPTAAPAAAAQAVARPGALVGADEHPAEQIIQSIRLNARGPQQEIDISLHPTELGTVRMRFQHADGGLRGVLYVDKVQTRYEIEKELPQIIASLQQNGVQIRRLDVVMNQPQNQQNESHNPAHDDAFAEAHGRFENHASGHGDPDLQEEFAQSQDAPVQGATSPTPARESCITDEAINVYV